MWISAASLRYRVKWASAPERPISRNCPQQRGSAPGVPRDRLLLDEPLGVVARLNGSVPLIRCNAKAPSTSSGNPPLLPSLPSPPPPPPPECVDVQLCSVFGAPVTFSSL